MALGRLTASIAHEIRNPLGAISHASQLLGESENIAGDDLRLLSIINTHSQRVNLIIQNILELSRHHSEVPELLNIKVFLKEFLNQLGNSYRDSPVCTLEVDPANLQLRFNTSQLEQLLTNLCDNGLRYSRKHTGVPSLDIRVSLHPASQSPVLDIIDMGPGVPKSREEQIFEPFFTTENSGTGLALFICKEICEANQARIYYRRTDKQQSCFRIIFAHADRHID